MQDEQALMNEQYESDQRDDAALSEELPEDVRPAASDV